MKKFLLMWLALFAVSVVSCGDSKQDEPKSPEDTDYGEIKPTGVKRAVIYYNEAYGETSFTIPGFAKFHTSTNNDYYGDIYEIFSDSDVGFCVYPSYETSVSDIHWDGTGEFSYSWKIPGGGITSFGCCVICRHKVSKAGEYPERFVYARMRLVDYMYSGPGANIGVVIEYDAPYTIGE